MPIRKTDKRGNLDDIMVKQVGRESLTEQSAFVVMLILLLFLSLFSVLAQKAEAAVVVPYDDIGIEWTKNPNLVMSEGSWDSRVWYWSTSSLELQHSDASNYVRWNVDGQVELRAQDEAGGMYRASNFDQGYERYEDEIYDLNVFGWDNKACSFRVEGLATVFDGMGYTGSNHTYASDVPDLSFDGWAYRVSSLKLSRGSRITLHSQVGYSGVARTFISPSYQPPDLKVAEKSSVTLEGVISNWFSDTSIAPGWTGAKFDIFAVEDRYSGTGLFLMLEMYFLREGANLAWGGYNLLPGCSGDEREAFRGPPFQNGYNYLVALDSFPVIANRTIYPDNVAKWTIDVKGLIQRACDHDWGVSPSTYRLDIDKLNIVKVCFTVESANLGSSARAGCTLNRLRLAYTDTHAATVYSEEAYAKIAYGSSWFKVSDASSLSGFAMKAAASSLNGGVLYGPYIAQGSDGSLLAGKPFISSFKLKVSSNVSNDIVAYFDVCCNAGTTIMKSRLLRATDFASSNVWQDFELPFVAPNSMAQGLEFRVNNQNNGITDLYVDRIVLSREWDSSTIFFEGPLDKPQDGSSWTLVNDASAYYGQIREASSSAQNGACLYGPYIKKVTETELATMPLIVSFRLKTSSNTATQTMARIDAAFNAGTVIQSEQIKANDFTSANKWQKFTMSIIAPDTMIYGLEFRLFNLNRGVADLFFDGISLAKDNSVVYSERASDKTKEGTSWSQWDDPTSLSGVTMRASSTSSNGGVLYGPYIKTDKFGTDMQGQSYTALFRVAVSSRVAQTNVLYLDVCYNAGVVLAQRFVRANDFDSPNVWQIFRLDFDAPASMLYGLEFRVMNLNYAVADVFVDKIAVGKS